MLQGGVKPIFEHIELEPGNQDLGTRLKTFFADSAIELLSDDVPGRDAVATVIPIKGDIDSPEVQLVPTVLGVVRNAFVIGLQSGFANLPPQTAPKKEGVVRQAVDALKKDEGPPQAQPEPRRREEDSRARPARPPRASPSPAPDPRPRWATPTALYDWSPVVAGAAAPGRCGSMRGL